MDARIDFAAVPWQAPVPGQRFGVVEQGRTRVRLAEFSEGFEEDGWCTVGHVGVVLEGALTVAFRSGGEQRLAAGDALLLDAGEAHAHKAVLRRGERARLLLVEDVAAAPTPEGPPGA